MQFIRKDQEKAELHKRRKTTKVKIESNEKYPFNLSFYLDPPSESISLKEFEEYAVARLKLLRAIERINLTSNVKYSLEWCKALETELKKLELTPFLAVATDFTKGAKDKQDADSIQNIRRFDYISHFLLRLAYCRSEDLKKWFIALEVDFFRFKLNYADKRDRKGFLSSHQLAFTEVAPETQEQLKHELLNANSNLSVNSINMQYYVVSFHVVLDLVRQRRVYLKDGLAYLPLNEIDLIVSTNFKKSLSHCVALTGKASKQLIDEDERLSQILKDFDKRYTGKNFDRSKKENDNSVCLDDLPEKSKDSFPLCMKELYNVVEKDHHLKHFGRLQLGLFLKGLGLSLEDATRFWRYNFTKKVGMDGNRFDKQYLYNIRHMYGKEGKRADYTPYSCMKIIMSSVGTGDNHGCPFRHFDATPLRSRLVAAKIPETGIKEIMKLVEDRHYQIACTKYYELTHGNETVNGGIQHPNQYFEESEKVKSKLI